LSIKRFIVRLSATNIVNQNLTIPFNMSSDQPRPKLLNFITGNVNKLKEVSAILGAVEGLELQSRDVPGLVEIQGTIEEVATDKCRRAAIAVSLLLIFVLQCLGRLVREGAC
jgi:hypothetical protein